MTDKWNLVPRFECLLILPTSGHDEDPNSRRGCLIVVVVIVIIVTIWFQRGPAAGVDDDIRLFGRR
jgi:hypothetical protein